MRVAIVGARSRPELPDTPLVNDILDSCLERFSPLLVVVASCDKGVGRIVHDRNINRHRPGMYEFDMIELQLRHYLQKELPKPEFTSQWNALNASIVELSDEFHILTEEKPKGATLDLLRRVREAHRPYALYLPSEVKQGPKIAKLETEAENAAESQKMHQY